MLQKVLASVLAAALILGMPIVSIAAPKDMRLAKSYLDLNREVQVIVQLEDDPVLVYEAKQKELGTFSVLSQAAHTSKLQKDLDSFISKAEQKFRGLKTDALYTHTFYGFSASLPFSQVAELEKIKGVKEVFPDLPVYVTGGNAGIFGQVSLPEMPVNSPMIDYTVPQTGAPFMWNMPGEYTGEGIIVAVIDTGVDVNHGLLTRWTPDPITEWTSAPAVVGCANFTADGGPDDVTDVHGHGTHVAGIIAADGRPYGPPYDEIIGMAPSAQLYAIKVLGNDGKGSSSWVMNGIEWAVHPTGGLRRADVINMSLGASISDPNYPTCQAANAAAEAGVIVVAAAGNEGHETATVGAPSVGAKVISVANYGYQQKAYILVEEQEITDVATCDSPEPDSLLHEVVYANLGRPEDFTGLDVAGKIALVQRGEIAFTDKGANAAAAGAIGIIVYNNAAGMISMAGEFTIPALSTTQEAGEYIRSRLTAVPGLQIAMCVDPARDLINSSSSGGPARDFSLKPDITAPGTAVYSLAPGNGFATMSGTSMASPHVAGGVALLKQMYGDTLSVEEYKALLMNTADLLCDENDDKYPVTVIGAGTMNLESAALSRGIATPASLSVRKDGAVKMFYVRNLSDAPVTYNISFTSPTLTALYPSPITVPANASYGFSFQINNLEGLADGPHEGYITLTPTDEAAAGHPDVLRIPVYHFVGAHESFYLWDFEVSKDAMYTYDTFDITFTLTQAVNYMQLALYNSNDEFQGGWMFNGGEPIPAGTWPLSGFDLIGLPPDTYTLELYAEMVRDVDYNFLLSELDYVQLEITSPADGDFVANENITVTGLAPLPGEVDIYLNDGPHHTEFIEVPGSFSFNVDLEEGPNKIEALPWSYEAEEYVDYVSITVTLDTIDPELTITAPLEGAVVSTPTVTVSGRAVDDNLASIWVDGTEVDFDEEGIFSTEVPVYFGPMTITVEAVDQAGNTATETVDIMGDYNAPVLTIFEPVNGSFTSESSITVSGQAIHENLEAVRVNGAEVTFDQEGYFTTQVGLTPGVNIITVVAEDGLGGSRTQTVQVTQDSVAPQLLITAPTDGAVMKTAKVTVSGQATDDNLAVVRVNGLGVDFSDGGNFTTKISLRVGANTIIVEAEDLAGNITTETVTVTRETTPTPPPPPPPPTPPVPEVEPVEVTRRYGADRFATAVELSKKGWDTAECVVLARGDIYADALAGAPLAFALDAPILLTESAKLTPVTEAEILRLCASRVIILGGTSAISQQTEDALKDLGLTVERIVGTDRYATAALIAEKIAPNGVAKAVLASGENYPDALSVAAYAAKNGMPILLTLGESLPDVTETALKDLGVKETLVVGGTDVIGNVVLKAVPGGARISGDDRYATSLAVARHFNPPTSVIFIATGAKFADALCGAVLAAKHNCGILLVHSVIPVELARYLTDKGVVQVVILGGTSSVSTKIENAIKALLE